MNDHLILLPDIIFYDDREDAQKFHFLSYTAAVFDFNHHHRSLPVPDVQEREPEFH